MISLELSFYACLELVSMHMSSTAVKNWKSMLKIEDHQPRLFEIPRRLFEVFIVQTGPKLKYSLSLVKGSFQICEDCLAVFINCMSSEDKTVFVKCLNSFQKSSKQFSIEDCMRSFN